MRPLELTISAFGSYAGCEHINMEQLGTEGLYLITGPTGAGKSTIFDAMVFALYGEASSTSEGHKEAGMLRSMYAEPQTPTYVELRFENGGKEYTIRRNPGYSRPKTRGEGETRENPAAALTLPSGKVITRLPEVSRNIDEILGLTREQFSQITMIAQGEFRKFLSAKTAERQKIFQTLFQTEMYSKLAVAVTRKSKEAHLDYTRLREQISGEIKRVSLAEDSAYYEDWQRILEDPDKVSAAVQILQAVLEEEITADKEADARITELDKQLTDIGFLLEEAKNRRKLEQKFTDGQAKLAALEENLKKSQVLHAQALEREPELVSLREQIAIEKSKLPDYEALERNRRDLTEKKNRLRKLEDNRENLKDRQQKAEEALASYQEEMNSLSGAALALAECETNLKTIDRQAGELKELRDEIKAFETEQQLEQETRQELRMAQAAEQQLNEKLEQLEKEEKALQGADSQLIEKKNERKTLQTRRESFEKVESSCRKLQSQLRSRQQAYSRWAVAQGKLEDQESRYKDYFHSFLGSQAGILARDLQEGKPCPVCGATHHPSPASQIHTAVTQDILERAEADKKAAAKAAETEKEAALTADANMKKQEEQIALTLEDLFAGPIVTRESTSDNLKEWKKMVTDELDSIQTADFMLKQETMELEEKADTHLKLTQTIIPGLKEKLDRQRERVNAASGELSNLQGKLHTAWRNLKKQAENSLPGLELQEGENLSGAKNLLGRREKAAQDEQKRLLLLGSKLRDQKNRYEKLSERLIPQKRKEAELGRGEIAENDSKISAAKSELETRADFISRQEQALPYAGEAAAKQHISKLEGMAAAIDKQIKISEGQVKEQQSQIQKAEGEQKVRKTTLAGMKVIDETAEKEREARVLEQKDQMKKIQSAVKGYLMVNRQVLEALDGKDEALKGAKTLYQDLDELDKTANGGFSGKNKIRLETYVQSAYLDQVVKQANVRLRDLSAGQYTLVRHALTPAEKQGDHMLDLDVKDHHNGSIRSVNTLSGGEAFLASLSLALGMSDIVAASANNVRMDTMFVDEGFGSLDEDTLRIALSALQKLTEGGRLVGIISHVGELRRIPKKIVVSKDLDGRSRTKVVLES